MIDLDSTSSKLKLSFFIVILLLAILTGSWLFMAILALFLIILLYPTFINIEKDVTSEPFGYEITSGTTERKIPLGLSNIRAHQGQSSDWRKFKVTAEIKFSVETNKKLGLDVPAMVVSSSLPKESAFERLRKIEEPEITYIVEPHSVIQETGFLGAFKEPRYNVPITVQIEYFLEEQALEYARARAEEDLEFLVPDALRKYDGFRMIKLIEKPKIIISVR